MKGSLNHKRLRRLKMKIRIILIILIGIIGCGVYIGTYYHADAQAVGCLEGNEVVKVEQYHDEIWFMPRRGVADTAIIFYPGAKVDAAAYAPLMQNIVEEGIVCVIDQMPFHMAVFGVNRAEDTMQRADAIQHWYIAGHSLGGAMAAKFVSSHQTEMEGLILLAAYSTEDLSNTSLRVLSIYGDQDGVLNLKKYDQYRTNLPESLEQIVLKGGNHAQFGMYGKQWKDGEAKMTGEKQRTETAKHIVNFLK